MAASVPPQARLRDVLPLEQDVPALGAVQAAQQREQRGFPAAGGAQNRVQLALLQLAAGAPQKGLLAIVGVRQVDKFQKAHGYDHSFPLRSKAPKRMKHSVSDTASRKFVRMYLRRQAHYRAREGE